LLQPSCQDAIQHVRQECDSEERQEHARRAIPPDPEKDRCT
jgi:hypothetical protein